MQKTRVYDYPTRFFHWLFAGLFVFAFTIAKWIDDDSPFFSFHMLAGLSLSFLVFLRILWGLFGSRYAKFRSFPLSPTKLVQYFLTLFRVDAKHYFGHNPASAWAAILLMAIALALGTTGVLMAGGQKEEFEDLHELLADGFLVVAGAHVAGVLFHQVRRRDGIIFAMLHGMKESPQSNHEPVPTHPIAAMVLGAIFTLFVGHVLINFDSAKGTTQVFGVTLQLGEESEASEHQQGANSDGETEDDD